MRYGLAQVWRACLSDQRSPLVGLDIISTEHFLDNHRLFLVRLQRKGDIIEAGDVIALGGSRHVLLSEISGVLEEVDDAALLTSRSKGQTLWFMNALGLAAAPTLLSGLKELGPTFVLWSLFASAIPSLMAIYIGKYVFRFDDAILFGCCAGARKSSPALAMLAEKAESQVPAIGFSVGYAISTTLLILFGLVIVILM